MTDLSQLKHEVLALAHTAHHDPVRIIAFLAAASAVTFIIALANDALAVRRKPAPARIPPPQPRE
jgi:hypothetical protein